jgi:hypothetical protein
LLLAVALMESLGIEVVVCTDPAYAGVEGFALDVGRRAIVANWVRADGIWHVDVTDRQVILREYGDATGYAVAHSTIKCDTSGGRLRGLADYLELDWGWLRRRCADLGAHGCGGLAQPRSRLLSLAGLDQACRFVGSLGGDAD